MKLSLYSYWPFTIRVGTSGRLRRLMSILRNLGQEIMKKNSYFLATVFAAAFATEIIIDSGVNALWEWNNRGVQYFIECIVVDNLCV